MKQHRDKANIVLSSALAIKRLAICADNKISLGQLGCCEELVEVLQSYGQHEEIVLQACWAARNVSSYFINQVKIGKINTAFRTFVTVLRQHRHHVLIAEQVCATVWHVATAEENKEGLWRAGCCEELITIMKLHKAHATVMKVTCGAVKELAGRENVQRHLEKIGAMEMLLAVLKLHTNNEQVLEQVYGAMKAVSGQGAHH
jgi:hypothetical protein